jgi:hypothetical protein
MSPANYLRDLSARWIVLMHDRDHPVTRVGESRSLRAALAGRAGVHYTEFTMFKHLDPTKGNPSPLALARELVRFAADVIYPIFEPAAA